MSVGALKLAPPTKPNVFSFVSSVSGLSFPGVEPLQMRIAVTMGDDLKHLRYLTKDNFDYKPMFSPRNDKITFFRTIPEAEAWETAQIMVMNSDGSNLHSVSGDMGFNMNPAWMRDGSDRVSWSHISDYTYLNYTQCLPGEWCPWRAYINCDTCGPDDIRTLSDHAELGELEKQGILPAEWAYDSFHDGRILLIRQLLDVADKTVRTVPYALKVSPPGTPHAQRMRAKEFFKLDGLDWNVFVHKVTLSPSERYMSYMRNGAEGAQYRKSMLCYCNLDGETLTLSNEVLISTDENTQYWDWYARFTYDEQYIIYSSNRGVGNFQIWRYHLESRTTTQLTELDLNFKYPCPVGMTTFNANPGGSVVDVKATPKKLMIQTLSANTTDRTA